MRAATLLSWLVTASLGGFMLHTWLARDGLHRARAAAGGLPPPRIFGPAAAALTGLVIWIAFIASGIRPLAWAAVGLLMVAIGLGLCTVTLWTPYPARRPAVAMTAGGTTAEPGDALAIEVTDEMIARLLAEPVRAPRQRPVRPDPAVLVPVAHGFAAIGTFALAVMSAIR
jgi:manganese efflux pump family protein